VAGALPVVNTSLPGSIKIAVVTVKPLPGSGQIATIVFAGKPGTGGITSANVSMIDSSYKQVPATVTIINKSGNTNTTPPDSGTPVVPINNPTVIAGSTGQTAVTTPTYPGTVTLPTDLQQRVDSKPAPPSTVPDHVEEPTTDIVKEQTKPADKPVAETKAEVSPQYIVYKGVVDRFKVYKGSKELSAIAALFDKKIARFIQQEPAILINNGKNRATITVDIPAKINSSPNFAVNGGTLVSFKKNQQNKGRWTVEILPEVDTVNVILTIITGVEEFEFPLTITPPIKTALTLDERGWKKFLKEVGSGKMPLHDLNSDGVRDYIDEYIFVANYLAGLKVPTKADLPSQKTKK
jgi:hypothetical protein